VNPGVHTVVAKVGGGPETRATLETHEGETKDLELGVQPPPEGEARQLAGPQPPPQPPPPPPKKNTFATVSFIIAGVSGAVGAVAGLAAISGEGDLDKECRNKVCGRDQWDALDSARTWGYASTTFFVIGGVALATGLVATIASGSSKSGGLPPRTASAPPVTMVKVRPVFGLGGAGIHGSF